MKGDAAEVLRIKPCFLNAGIIQNMYNTVTHSGALSVTYSYLGL